jgi:LmbE family N-acetylglucosaminyl deacetylase
MIALNFEPASTLKILCLGAHSDDIEIGCGATILRLLKQQKVASIHWIVFSANRKRADEARRSACSFLKQAPHKKIVVKQFRDGFFPYQGAVIKKQFERLKNISPNLIFTHYRHDLHQDHRLMCELTWNTFREHLVLEYEIPKFDGDLGNPNLFVEIDEGTCSQKIDLLMNKFKSQRAKHWFTEQTFRSLLALRGMESRSRSKYAEAFYGRKVVLA